MLQARDLRQLLLLYDLWGRSAAPALQPAKFFDQLEKIGQTAPLKVLPHYAAVAAALFPQTA